MKVLTLLVLALVGLVIFVLWKHFGKKHMRAFTESFQMEDHTAQVSSMDTLGKLIMDKIGLLRELPLQNRIWRRRNPPFWTSECPPPGRLWLNQL